MSTKIVPITIRTNVGFRAYVTLTDGGAGAPLDGYAWKFLLADAAHRVVKIGDTVPDETVPGRLWLTLPQISAADLAPGRLYWYLLGKDPAGYLRQPFAGPADIVGGPPWS